MELRKIDPLETQRLETLSTNKKESGWQNETKQRSEAVKKFLKQDFDNYGKTHRERYDSLSELHFSGTNSDVMAKIKSGNPTIITVETLYQNGEITQIHAVLDKEGSGHNIDVYFTGKALADFLEGSK